MLQLGFEALDLRGRRLDVHGTPRQTVGDFPSRSRNLRLRAVGAIRGRPGHRQASVQLMDGCRSLDLRSSGGRELREAVRRRLGLPQGLMRLVTRGGGARLVRLERRQLPEQAFLLAANVTQQLDLVPRRGIGRVIGASLGKLRGRLPGLGHAVVGLAGGPLERPEAASRQTWPP